MPINPLLTRRQYLTALGRRPVAPFRSVRCPREQDAGRVDDSEHALYPRQQGGL